MKGICPVLTLLFAFVPTAWAQVSPLPGVEILRDARVANGVRVASRSNYPPELQAEARQRWLKAVPASAEASWEFIEIAETQNLADNPETPQADGHRLIYASRDGSKRFEADTRTGEIRYFIDTEREWRGGCNLAAAQDGIEPRCCKGKAWNWPHFLVSQVIRDPRRVDRPLPLASYAALAFRFSARLASCALGQPNPCPPGAWGEQKIDNHCLFYVAFVMVHNDPGVSLSNGNPAARVLYALYPVFCSWDGKTHSSPNPWLGIDPAGHAVYWTPNRRGLELGRWTDVAVDVSSLAREAVAEINRRYQSNLSAGEYSIRELLVGWEIWGPFRCDINLRGLSFVAAPG